MPGDLDDAEALVRAHGGLENDDVGMILSRLVRQVRVLAVKGRDLEARMQALETKPTAPPNPPV